MESSFNLQKAKALQNAEWYKNAAFFFMLLAGLSISAAFYTELKSCFVFNDWLRSHEWTQYIFLRDAVEWFSQIIPMALLVFGIFGVLSLFPIELGANWLAKAIRFLFIAVILLTLLVPVLRGEHKRLIIIGLLFSVYFLFRWLSNLMANQRPKDWKILVKERKRLGWRLIDFAAKLPSGKAGDGNPLAIIQLYGPQNSKHLFLADRRVIDEMLYEGVLPGISTRYILLSTISRLANSQCISFEILPEYAEKLRFANVGELSADSNTLSVAKGAIWVHPEIEDRMLKIYGL